ncbi:MAG: hypothetical protein U0930_22175 [Pirellulales bacterium]
MAHALLCLICILYPKQSSQGDEELRKICYDRIVELEDAREFERATSLARAAKKKFPNDPRFEFKHQVLEFASLRSIPLLNDGLGPDQRAIAKYRIDELRGIDPSIRAEKLNEKVNSIIQQIDPDSTCTGRTVIMQSPDIYTLVICTSRDNHSKIQDLVGKDALQPWRK